ncbi:glycoside hydrolase family 9 protein [Pedobacter sp. N36a]|uniref:glycoside hydrolase family 9 protein n=1 Tax=Pedobacter sp. N36a TaxID=2767996 RepID=UPI001657539F|nr:glycoside hydrolase family 9 protein [Pedobacter sp. N36a]MBC8988286.1 glycoside hydrolase family 9 protein [Pedobacter sp. N36a]
MSFFFKSLSLYFFLTFICASLNAQQVNLNNLFLSENIRFNQLGFYPNAQKIAVITSDSVSKFAIVTVKENRIVFTGILKASTNVALNGKKTLIANFSEFKMPGDYIIYIQNMGYSYQFSIKNDVFAGLAKGSIKAFYYQRASIALPQKYAGQWPRNAGHPDNEVLIHPSAATKEKPFGTIISAPRGWYDAGDYNKYIVNSGITTATLLSLYEDFPSYVKNINLNIPESSNKIPDELDEILWNIRWMLCMQDQEDGGVYNKLTNAFFDGMVMPEITKLPRYVVQKGTSATLDFAAVTAQASRIFKNYDKQLPGLSDSCLNAANKAWEWALKNPNMAYDQNLMNNNYEPKITTGGYGDRNFTDEFIWAAIELYITTKNEKYYNAVNILPDEQMPLPSWNNVRLLGYYSLLRNEVSLKNNQKNDTQTIKSRLLKMANDFIEGSSSTAYQTVMGKTDRDFGWGSNANAANQGIALIQAYQITKDKKYLDHALSNLDYLLGRNATGFSYITGFGSKTPMFPHHRPSAADRVKEPVPGFLVGGPNPGKQDGVVLPSTVADEAYTDSMNSYAANEIAINWNAPLAYLVNAIQALQYESDYSKN